MNQYPKAYIKYLIEFHQTRDFFECHEILEEYWKEHPDHPHKTTWHGLIQIAVGLYHQRRGNLRGAFKMLTSAVQMLSQCDLESLGLDNEKLLQQLRERLLQLSASPELPYTDMIIPVGDEALLAFIEPAVPSSAVSEDIVHKHLRRDRSEVIAARKAELLKRSKK